MTQGPASSLLLGALVLCCGGMLQCPQHEERYEPGNHIVLAIENHSFGRLDQDTFEGVQKALPLLETLILRNTSVRMIAPDSFAHLTTLNCLDLTDNEIVYLRDRGELLRGVANLTTLVLARNHLRTVSDSAFIYARHLLRLDLSENELDVLSLSNAALRGLGVLEELYLDNNDLTHLSPLLFSHTPSLLKLGVSNNPLVKVGIYSLPQLQIFNAQNSLLSEFPRFPRSTRSADLRDGHISRMEAARSVDLLHFETLLLSGNPWSCNCDILWFLRWSARSKNIVADYFNMTCSEPKAYRGAIFNSVVNDLICANEENASVAFNTQINALRGPVFRVEGDEQLQTTSEPQPLEPSTELLLLPPPTTTTIEPVLPLSPFIFLLPSRENAVIDGSRSSINRAAVEKYLSAKKIAPFERNATTLDDDDAFEADLISPSSSASSGADADAEDIPGVIVVNSDDNSSHSAANASRTVLISSLIGEALSWPMLALSLIFGVLFAALFIIAALIVRAGVRSLRQRRRLDRCMRQSPAATINQPSVTVSPARSDIILCNSSIDEPRRYNALDQYVPRMSLPDSDHLTESKARTQSPPPQPATLNDADSLASNAHLVTSYTYQEDLHDDDGGDHWPAPPTIDYSPPSATTNVADMNSGASVHAVDTTTHS